MEDLKFKTAGQVMVDSNSTTDQSFQCAHNSSFQMDINGFRISVAFGPGMHVKDKNIRRSTNFDAPMEHRIWGTNSAEILIWDRNDNPIIWDKLGSMVVGLCSSDTVARVIGCLVNWPSNESPKEALLQIMEADID